MFIEYVVSLFTETLPVPCISSVLSLFKHLINVLSSQQYVRKHSIKIKQLTDALCLYQEIAFSELQSDHIL